jgi:phage shock protein PspC (stress-responsive transcriptional regulator)
VSTPDAHPDRTSSTLAGDPTQGHSGGTTPLRKDLPVTTTLVRPRSDRMIAGVCSGIGRRFGISANVVRLVFLLSMLLPGPQILIYLAGWLLIPKEY